MKLWAQRNKTTGVSDSSDGSTDYLGYSVQAKALVEVAKAIEEPDTPLCIAVYHNWKVGKSRMGSIIKGLQLDVK